MKKQVFFLVFLLYLASSTADIAYPTAIELKPKPNSRNYAKCDGVYRLSTNAYINGKPIYLNGEKSRFIFHMPDPKWCITSFQYLPNFFVVLLNKPMHRWGSFHCTNMFDGPITDGKWKEYDSSVKEDQWYGQLYFKSHFLFKSHLMHYI